MAVKFSHVVFAIFSLVLVSFPILGSSLTVYDWMPIPYPGKDQIALAEFAVTEHNKEMKTSLVFQSMKSMEFQFVKDGGFNYRCLISAKNGDAVNYHIAVVHTDRDGNSRKLTYFK